MKYYKIASFIVIIIISCRYKDGPLVELESPEGRVMGDWRLEKILKDGNPVSAVTCSPNQWYAQVMDLPFSFRADNMVNAGIEFVPYCYYSGTWRLKNNKKIIELNFKRQYCYNNLQPHYCDTTFISPVFVELEILRLTKKYRSVGKDEVSMEGDLWVEEKRNDGTYEFHFKAYQK